MAVNGEFFVDGGDEMAQSRASLLLLLPLPVRAALMNGVSRKTTIYRETVQTNWYNTPCRESCFTSKNYTEKFFVRRFRSCALNGWTRKEYFKCGTWRWLEAIFISWLSKGMFTACGTRPTFWKHLWRARVIELVWKRLEISPVDRFLLDFLAGQPVVARTRWMSFLSGRYLYYHYH